MKVAGRFRTYKHPKFGWIVAAWPRKRGSYQSERQRQWGDLWRAVNHWMRQVDPVTALDCFELSKNTPFMPRDLMVKMATGRMWTIELSNGTTLWNVNFMADEVQALLDTITMSPGAMLLRSPIGWIGIEPGAVGTVLTGNGPGQMPAYLPVAAPSASGGLWASPTHTSPTSAPYNTEAAVISPIYPMKVTTLWTWLFGVNDGDFTVMILELAGATVSAITWVGAMVHLAVPVDGQFFFDMTGSPTLVAGKSYALALCRVATAGTAYLKVGSTTGSIPTMPVQSPAGGWRATTATPIVGTVGQSTGSIGIGYKVEV